MNIPTLMWTSQTSWSCVLCFVLDQECELLDEILSICMMVNVDQISHLISIAGRLSIPVLHMLQNWISINFLQHSEGMWSCKTTDNFLLCAMPLALVGMHISVSKINMCTDIFCFTHRGYAMLLNVTIWVSSNILLYPSEGSTNDNLGSISAQLKLTTLSKNGVSLLKDLFLQAYDFVRYKWLPEITKIYGTQLFGFISGSIQ